MIQYLKRYLQITGIVLVIFYLNAEDIFAQTVITHAKGKITVPESPQRVVVFDIGTLENYHELGIPVVGVPSNIPGYIAEYRDNKYVKAGSLKGPNIKTVQKLKPDLIIISSRQAAAYDSLSAIAPTLFISVDTEDAWASFHKNVEMIAKIHHKERLAKTKLKAINEKVELLRKSSMRDNHTSLTALSVAGRFQPNGAHSRFGFAYDILGLKPAYVDTTTAKTPRAPRVEGSTPPPQEPYIAKLDPDYVFIIDRQDATSKKFTPLNELANDDLKQSRAYKENKVYLLNAEGWYLSGGGLISVDLQISDIGKYAYGLFTDKK